MAGTEDIRYHWRVVSSAPGLVPSAQSLRRAVSARIVGQEEVVTQVLTAVFAGGHCLLLGVPGLAKTLLVRTIAESLDLAFSRIQFTPDLMPSDITGTEVIMGAAGGERAYRFLNGPLFSNVVLADEINRTPPKTQAALLEAMEEGQVTCGGERHALPAPFLVMATQNPIEQEGTYPLPVAALDRFLFMVRVGYPTREEEDRIVLETLPGETPRAAPALSRDDFLRCAEEARGVLVPDEILALATRLVRASRPGDPHAPPATKEFVSWGASPRGVQAMVSASRARAALEGRPAAARDDLAAVAAPALRHRIVLNFHAEAEGFDADRLVGELLTSCGLLEREAEVRPSVWGRLLGLRAQPPGLLGAAPP